MSFIDAVSSFLGSAISIILGVLVSFGVFIGVVEPSTDGSVDLAAVSQEREVEPRTDALSTDDVSFEDVGTTTEASTGTAEVSTVALPPPNPRGPVIVQDIFSLNESVAEEATPGVVVRQDFTASCSVPIALVEQNIPVSMQLSMRESGISVPAHNFQITWIAGDLISGQGTSIGVFRFTEVGSEVVAVQVVRRTDGESKTILCPSVQVVCAPDTCITADTGVQEFDPKEEPQKAALQDIIDEVVSWYAHPTLLPIEICVDSGSRIRKLEDVYKDAGGEGLRSFDVDTDCEEELSAASYAGDLEVLRDSL